MKRYEFTITLAGQGETPEEAWQDAVEQFSIDPGSPPDEYIIEDQEE